MHSHQAFNPAMAGRHLHWYRLLRAWLEAWLRRHRAPQGRRWYDVDGSGL